MDDQLNRLESPRPPEGGGRAVFGLALGGLALLPLARLQALPLAIELAHLHVALLAIALGIARTPGLIALLGGRTALSPALKRSKGPRRCRDLRLEGR